MTTRANNLTNKTTGIEEAHTIPPISVYSEQHGSATPFSDRDRELKKSLTYHLGRCLDHIESRDDAALLISLKIVGEYRWELDHKFHQIGLVREKHFALQMLATVAREDFDKTMNDLKLAAQNYQYGHFGMADTVTKIEYFQKALIGLKADLDNRVAAYEAHIPIFDDVTFDPTNTKIVEGDEDC